jgi:hypothetical protein
MEAEESEQEVRALSEEILVLATSTQGRRYLDD